MATVKAWWPKEPKPGNVGDIITPVIIKSLFNLDVSFFDISKNKNNSCKVLLSTGSIINKAVNKNFVVWGSGAMRVEDGKKVSKDAEILAVRGPLTREILYSNGISTNGIMGDTALLLPTFFNPNIKKEYEYGIIPHYVDYKEVKKRYEKYKNIKVVNVLNSNPLSTIKEILKCKKTISSSLHGIIFSNSYNIKSTWVKFSNKLKGDGTKFNDYFQYCNDTSNCLEEDFVNPSNFEKLKYIKIKNNNHDENLKKLRYIFEQWLKHQ